MPAADLDFPLAEFKSRAKQIRQIMAVVEAASQHSAALTTTRTGIDLSQINASTSNTVNSMALIYLASAFEDHIREQAIQCGNQLMDAYTAMPDLNRHSIRDIYWSLSRERLKFTKSVLVNKSPDPTLLGTVGGALDALQGFVIGDDASKLDSETFGHHSNNFRPGTVVEIFGRFGVKDLINRLGENAKLKNYFGVTSKVQCAERLKAKWDEFYDRRNETVHSLGGASGFAVDAIDSYIEFLEMTADALKGILTKTLTTWT